MTMRKKKPFTFVASFLAFVILCTSLVAAFPLSVSAEGERTVTAVTNAEVKQGDSVRCSVYVDFLSGLSALDVSVHFDPDKVSISSSYNCATAILYDSSVKEDCVQYTYIFDGDGAASKTEIFYFYYTVKSNAEPGKTYFDVIVSDAYDAGLSPVNVKGTRTSMTVLEKPVSKTCSISTTSSVLTSVENEFELTYQLNTYQIASGSFAIRYDPDLFEVVSATNGNFLDGKIADVNTNMSGGVYVSFVSTEYNTKKDLITVRFKTKQNISEKSEIRCEVTDFYDLERNPLICKSASTSVNVAFDEDYFADVPCMKAVAEYDAGNDQYALLISLDADSNLGAGDFTLRFDSTYLSYVSSEKLFTPTFFNVNDKAVDEGVLKYSIISMTDIVGETDVLKVVFSVAYPHDATETVFMLSGSFTTDSMTNMIYLNYVAPTVTVPGVHSPASAVEENRVEASYTETGFYDEVVYCSVCHEELSRVQRTIPKICPVALENWVVNHSASLTENFAYNYYYTLGENGSDFGKYDEVWLEVRIRDYSAAAAYEFRDEDNVGYNLTTKTLDWTKDTSKGYGRYRFTLRSIAAAQVGDLISASLHAVKNGQEYCTSADESSIALYAYNRIEKSSDAALKPLLVNMLNYCAKAQSFFGYHTKRLVNADLTAAQKALATAEDVVPTQEQNIIPLDGTATGFINSKTINLGNAIELKYYMTFDNSVNLENVKLHLSYQSLTGETVSVVINGSDFGYDAPNCRYFAKLTTIAAADTGCTVSATLSENGIAVSDTLEYGIEAYCKNRFEKSSDAALKDLLQMMLKYTRNAQSYFSR